LLDVPAQSNKTQKRCYCEQFRSKQECDFIHETKLKKQQEDITAFKLSWWFIVNVDSAFGCWHHVEAGCVSDVQRNILPPSSGHTVPTLKTRINNSRI
jgi:uncharacterized membrane protein